MSEIKQDWSPGDTLNASDLNSNFDQLQSRYKKEFTSGEDITKGQAVYLKGNSAIDLELSSSQYLSISDGSQTGLDLSSDFTFECWIKLEQLPSTAGTNFSIITKNNDWDAAIDRGFQFWINSSDILGCWITGITTTQSSYSTMDEAFDGDDVGVWIHLAVSWDASASEYVFYKNGVLKGGTSISSTANNIRNSTGSFLIGSTYGTGANKFFFDGMIDEVRVWSDIRTITEINTNKDVELIGTEDNLVGYWNFNNNLLDVTSNNNDLTNNGSAVFSILVPFSTGDKIFKASSANINTSDNFIGFAEETTLAGVSTKVVIGGLVTGLTDIILSHYYLADTAGTIDTTAGSVTRKVGIGISETELIITNIW